MKFSRIFLSSQLKNGDKFLTQSFSTMAESGNKKVPAIGVSFSGCGFLGLYHIGSLACFRDHSDRIQITRAAGASAGALVAIAALLGERGLSVSVLKAKFTEVVNKVNNLPFGAFNPSFNVGTIFREELTKVLPLDAHRQCSSGRLTVSLSDLKLKNILVKDFESNADLIDAVICSCYLPGFSGYELPQWRGKQYLDGGFSDNQPNITECGKKTVRVSPFASNSHVSPVDERNSLFRNSGYLDNMVTVKSAGGEEIEVSTLNVKRLLNTVVPSEDLEHLYEQGYMHTKKFLERPDLAEFYIKDSEDLELD